MEFTVKQIATLLGGEVAGNESLTITGLAKIEEGQPGDISFLSNLKYEPHLYTTQASAVIVDRSFEPKKPVASALIFVENSYSAFTRLLEEYHKQLIFARVGIEQPSYIGDGSQMGEQGYRGAFSYVGRNCQIGSNVKIYPQAYVGNNVRIGDNTIIYPGVRILDNCVIGRNCVIHPNAVIGSEGFGFAPQPDGTYKTIPQLGNVILEDNVNVGSNTTIDCATMGSTIIRQGAKLDNLIQIAHNVEIGKNTVIAAQTGVSGSTKLGDNCIIAGQVGFAGHLTIANGTKVGAQSGVGKSVEEEGTSLNSSPAFGLKESMRSLAVFRRLPDLEQRVFKLEKKNEK
ncbi:MULTISPECIES: UDP-3-O-(3-hydroxymyristoyl)glucosamine N-acyltransferase [unclassified Spirosoma]|uniref:UDP-3-O-(3-hydroxymyristoyl)glucosamine N-acyltransferase n=1 Tax=unclassified Spirosoma TaxID=2621999 RepID=UPI000968631B|nr:MULTISPECIES: UDP-3-O-(3-hydroxymyristoyl)glucosamine N-acyltransferase [unclassified Spirosoma]MBN8823193.1 UDP-3-O-(3-hydroxymyristoyl)glucosamine N-acyltransferase [Spirosoma sp.]OJW72656.1 MAG: UDP-3-O-(3-hydroxymyristoyl)glucosamine N-acyltransferase [Spirosoma sp. 48-14]